MAGKNDPEPKCCCTCCPIRTGTWLIGVVEILLAILSLICAIIAVTFMPPFGDKKEYLANSTQPFNYVLMGIGFLMLFTSSLLIYAALASAKALLIPHILCVILVILYLGARGTLIIMALDYKVMNQGLGVFAAMFALLMILLHVYFLSVIIRCYRWFGKLIKLRRMNREDSAVYYENARNERLQLQR